MAASSQQQHFWGVDLGGTKIEGVVLSSLETAQVVARLRIDTEQEKGYDHILRRINDLVESLAQQTGQQPKRLGIGTPGVIDPKSQRLKNSNTQCLNGKALHKDLEEILKTPCMLANDANCFALAESFYGAAKNEHVVFGVIMGTGVGGGIVIDRNILVGAQGIAGEWGHNVVCADGPLCYCGKRGCVETMLSGPALERYFFDHTGEKKLLHEIVQGARQDPRGAEADLLTHLLNWFGRALAVVVNILDPNVIVLGGGLSNIDELYTAGQQAVAKYVFNDHFETRIVRNALGDSAGVHGAAMLTA